MVEITQSARDAAEEWGGIVNHRDSEYEGDAIADLALAFAAAEHRGHIAGMREAAGIAEEWRDENKASKARAARQGNDKLAAMLDSAAIECNAIARAIRQRATAIETGADHTCHDQCQRTACVLRRENTRLRAQLEEARGLLGSAQFALHPFGKQETLEQLYEDDEEWAKFRFLVKDYRRAGKSLRDIATFLAKQEPTT